MNYCVFWIGILLLVSCTPKDTQCPCRSLEDCVDDQCVLQDNSYYINNQGVKGHNLYHGVIKGNICIDTLVFDINLEDPNPSHHYSFFANVFPLGLYHIPLEVGQKISENEYVLGSGVTICRPDANKEWYPSYVHCKIEPDSVVMTMKFLEWFDPSGAYVDSCQVTLYK